MLHLDAGSEPTPPDALPLVVVGASAGGVEALSVFVAGLPKPFPAPIVVAQHLDPRRRSQLPKVLGPRSTLPVRVVEDRLTLEPGVIYLVPADRNVEISDNQVSVQGDSSRHRPMPSIDRLLTSASRVFGERLIAVILSGLGTDGAIGARHVKAAGGTVVVQDPRTGRLPRDAQALAPGAVDIVRGPDADRCAAERPPERRVPVTRGRRGATPAGVPRRVRDRSGIDFSSYKRPTILRRLQRRMVATGATRLRDYVAVVLRTIPRRYERLVSSFLIKVTEFFRDPDLFGYLREIAIPELDAEARRARRRAPDLVGGLRHGRGGLLARDAGRRSPRRRAVDVQRAHLRDRPRRRGDPLRPSRASTRRRRWTGLPGDLVERYFVPDRTRLPGRQRSSAS